MDSPTSRRHRIERILFLGLVLAAVGVWGYLLLDSDSLLVEMRSAETPDEFVGSVEAVIPSTTIGLQASTLAMRKKLDMPVQLNVSDGPLTLLLEWFEEHMGLTFVYQADLSSLESVTRMSDGAPLREVLGDIFSRRNLGFILQRGNIVIIPCAQKASSSFDNGVRKVSFEVETEIFCRINEFVEFYSGDRAQYRLYLVARPVSGPAGESIYEIHYSIYKDNELHASGEVQAANEQAAQAQVPDEGGLFLEIRPLTDDGIELALGVTFRYTAEEESKPSAPVDLQTPAP